MRSSRQALAEITGRIEGACARSGRNPDEVRLVAVSKTVAADRVRAMADAGQTLFGENRVQEALEKIDALGPGLEWHFIGHLQKNKVRHVTGRFALIHSVDGRDLAEALNRRAGAAGIVQPILLQVNQAKEPTKHGVLEGELRELVEGVLSLENLDLRGLMSIPPLEADPDRSRRWFAGLRELRDRLAGGLGCPLPELSMGMTDSFEEAVEEGATLVRVGTALFGPRG